MLSVQNIKKDFYEENQKLEILKNINLDIKQGEFASIMGNYSSGKSTTLNLLAGIYKPTEGEIIIDGIKINELSDYDLAKFRNENIGTIFSTSTILDNSISAVEYVESAVLKSNWKNSARKKAYAYLDLVGFSYEPDTCLELLPTIEIQKVIIAMALSIEPKLLLLDEPTSYLDSITSNRFFFIVEELRKRNLMTIIMVTHDKNEAIRSNKIFHLKDGVLKEISRESLYSLNIYS